MNCLKLMFVFILSLTTTLESLSQVNLCGEIDSYHPIDKNLYQLRDSLFSSNIDTVAIYSHWIYTNGFNGYGKVIWIQNGEVYLLRLSYKKETLSIQRDEIKQVDNDSVFTYFFENEIDTIKTNPDRQEFSMSHDGRHFFQITWNEESYCFLISNLLVRYNPDNKRVQLINRFKESRD